MEDAVAILEAWTQERRLELVQIPSGQQPRVAPPGHVTACDLVVALESERFVVTSEQSYATVVGLDDSRSGLPRLRARGLIRDSPRLIGRDHRVGTTTASR